MFLTLIFQKISLRDRPFFVNLKFKGSRFLGEEGAEFCEQWCHWEVQRPEDAQAKLEAKNGEYFG